MSRSLFSESWFRLAPHQAWLHPSVEIVRQRFRGQPWFLLRDPLTNGFYRLRPAAFQFIRRLRPGPTIDDVWRECQELFPDEAPTQDEVLRLLARLSDQNLLASDLPPDTTQLFERRRKTDEKEWRSKLMQFLFLRIPLGDPDPFLERILPLFRPFLQSWFAWVWGGFFLWAIKILVENWEAMQDQSQGLLSPDNLVWLYLAGIAVKTWHELGHALICKRLGGEVRQFGVMLVVLIPMPYVDASSSWLFPSRYRRMLVAAGGMIFELFLASLATLVWVATGPGAAHSVAFNIMVLASFTTLVFNANPLLRFDGYYIFSDWMELPNLGQRAQQELRYVAERFLFRSAYAVSVAVDRTETPWLVGYAIGSSIYRVFLISGIALIVAERFFEIGLLLGAFCLGAWFLVPLGRFIHYLFRDPALERNRAHALRVAGALLALLILLVAIVPFPRSVVTDGVVEAENFRPVFAEAPGFVAEALVPSGTEVKAGQPVLRLRNEELELKLQLAKLQMRQIQTRRSGAVYEAHAILPALAEQENANRQLIDAFQELVHQLTVTAPIAGLWLCPEDPEIRGTWKIRGATLGAVAPPGPWRFTAVVTQAQAAELFQEKVHRTTIRLRGQANQALRAKNLLRVPGEQQNLPAAALGWNGGGPIQTDPSDSQGLKAVEPFFLVYAPLEPHPRVTLLHHRTGRMKLSLPAQPLLTQGVNELRKMLQSRLAL